MTDAVYSKSAPSGAVSGMAYPLGPEGADPLSCPFDPLSKPLEGEPPSDPVDGELPSNGPMPPSVPASPFAVSSPWPSGAEVVVPPHAPIATPPSTIARISVAERMGATVVGGHRPASE